MQRFFIQTPLECTERLPADIAHQVARVLRLGAGAQVVLLDGQGRQAVAELIEVSAKNVTVRLGSIEPAPGEPEAAVTLYQGLPKAAKMESILQKAVELGVTAVVPVVMERSIVREVGEGKLARWQAIAREAAEQSGRGRVPWVCDCVTLAQAIVQMQNHGTAWVADFGGAPLPTMTFPKDIGLMIGPEGGVAPGERERLAVGGITSISLGPRILRCETAGPAAIAVIMAVSGGWA